MTKYFIIAFLLYSNNIFSQYADHNIKLTHYVFNKFSPGTVKMKSGETFNQVLNYNILTGEMIFDNNGKYLAIAAPENVDTVYISDRKFIPLNNKFYEVLISSNVPLLLEFTYTIKEPGASVGYGSSTNTSAAQSYKSLIRNGGAYDLKLPDDFKVIPGYSYWMMKENTLEKAGSAKQLAKIFPDKKDIINDLVKRNNITFSKREDIIELVKEVER